MSYPPGMIVKSTTSPDGISDYGVNPNYKPAGPKTLTKQQFAAKKPGGDYQNYLAYLANHRGASLGAANADPFAPTSPQDIASIVKQFAGMYGNPLTDAQIQTNAQAQIDPIIAAITKTANDRATASSSAITGLTDSYAKDLAGINYSAPYQQAEGQQAAVDSALQQSLQGAGSDLASQLKSRLAVLGTGDPAVAQASAGLADRGTAMGGTTVAQGSSALSNLIAQAAASSAYGAQLPGVAKLSGIQGVEQANSQAANDISTGTQSALSQLPQIVQALRSENQATIGNRASAASDIFSTLTGQNITKATAKAGLANTNFDNGIAQENADTAAYKATTAANTATTKAKAAAAKVAKGPSLTPNQSATIAKNAAKRAEDLFYGVTKPNASGPPTVVSHSVLYPDAVKTLTAEYPTLGKKGVLKLVNSLYSATGKFPDGTPNGRPVKALPANQSFPYAGYTGK